MVDESDLEILKRNYPARFVDLVIGFFKGNEPKDSPETISRIDIEENEGYYEAFWVRVQTEFNKIQSRTYLGRVRTYAF